MSNVYFNDWLDGITPESSTGKLLVILTNQGMSFERATEFLFRIMQKIEAGDLTFEDAYVLIKKKPN